MSNHSIDCDVCGNDLRGLSGGHAPGCNADKKVTQEEIVALLKDVAKRFREYEQSHADKHTIEGDYKARRNAEMAEKCEALLARM